MTSLPYYIILLLMGIILGGIIVLRLLSPWQGHATSRFDFEREQGTYSNGWLRWWWLLLLLVLGLLLKQQVDWSQLEWKSNTFPKTNTGISVDKATLAPLQAAPSMATKEEAPYFLLLVASSKCPEAQALQRSLSRSFEHPVVLKKHIKTGIYACFLGPFPNRTITSTFAQEQSLQNQILSQEKLHQDWESIP